MVCVFEEVIWIFKDKVKRWFMNKEIKMKDFVEVLLEGWCLFVFIGRLGEFYYYLLFYVGYCYSVFFFIFISRKKVVDWKI